MEKDLIVVVFKKPLWKLILATCIFTAVLFASIEVYNVFMHNDGTLEYHQYIAYSIMVIAFALVMAFNFSSKNTKIFDFKNKKYKNQFEVGFVKIGWWRKLPHLKYVSVFKFAEYHFEVNVWHGNNNKFNIYTYDEKLIAMEIAKKLAKQLNIDLFDATQKGDFKWIDKIN